MAPLRCIPSSAPVTLVRAAAGAAHTSAAAATAPHTALLLRRGRTR
ncbi:MAG TPA: hypothetical protein VNZ05_08870 [Solirubrobacteraceae bacterium]|nr:hypothetical protein [Solirubrobacteraceae bacterium]